MRMEKLPSVRTVRRLPEELFRFLCAVFCFMFNGASRSRENLAGFVVVKSGWGGHLAASADLAAFFTRRDL
jgi:hypothetical protein